MRVSAGEVDVDLVARDLERRSDGQLSVDGFDDAKTATSRSGGKKPSFIRFTRGHSKTPTETESAI